MTEVYEGTALTPMRVAQMSGFLDWSSQPSMFKHYPQFLFRYKYGENELLRQVELCRTITSEKQIASKPYYQLSTPSAGNLHPVELYVQIRGVKGVLSGIYHVDAGSSEIVLIKEIGDEGVEAYVGLSKKLSGLIFLVSCVPFRAEWKYYKRSIRYCYLDVGHQLGSISSVMNLYEQKLTILSGFDTEGLNEFMGFKGEEFVTAVLSSGTLLDTEVKKFKESLMSVSPTDYSELSISLADKVRKNHLFTSEASHFSTSVDESDILSRRSARNFSAEGLAKGKIQNYLELFKGVDNSLLFYNALLRDTYKKAGVYLGDKLQKEGSFAKKMSALLVDQSFVKNADVVTIITSKDFTADKLMQAGGFAHKLYMEAEVNKFGFSGIGAFYDKKLQEFLLTDDYILYVCVAGEEKK